MKYKYIILLTIVVILGLFAYVVSIGGSVQRAAPNMSRTVLESMKNESFKAEYEVDAISPSIIDSLNALNLRFIDFMRMEYWIENVWGISPNLIFFRKINHSKEMRLLISDPTSLNGNNPGPPFLAFKIKNTNKYSGSQGFGGSLLVFGLDSIPEMIDLEIYIILNHSTERYVGDLTLKCKSDACAH